MLALISLLIATPAFPAQDEIVRTAPVANAAYARQDCMFGGQPVACPQPAATTPVVPASDDEEDEENPWATAMRNNFQPTTDQTDPQEPAEGGYYRNGGIRGTAASEPNAPTPTPTPRLNWSAGARRDGAEATQAPSAPFDWSRGARPQDNGSSAPSAVGEYTAAFYGNDGGGTDRDAVPEWAFADPAKWESDQCGDGTSEPSQVCRRNARNRLAMARADQATAADQDASSSTAPPSRTSRCRRIDEPSQNGGPASSSLVCGNGDADALLDMMRERAERVAVPRN